MLCFKIFGGEIQGLYREMQGSEAPFTEVLQISWRVQVDTDLQKKISRNMKPRNDFCRRRMI